MVEIECPLCGGPPRFAVPFGTLLQCQCRNCGIGFNTPLPEDEEEEDDP